MHSRFRFPKYGNNKYYPMALNEKFLWLEYPTGVVKFYERDTVFHPNTVCLIKNYTIHKYKGTEYLFPRELKDECISFLDTTDTQGLEDFY
jgi:hypothetical protein